MKNNILFLFIFITQVVFAQNNSFDKKYNAAVEEYNISAYDNAIVLINELKSESKSIPRRLFYLEIVTKYEMLSSNSEFIYIANLRKLCSEYLNKFKAKKNDDYKEILRLNNELKAFPKDLAAYNEIRDAEIKEAALIKENEEREALEAKQKAELQRVKQLEQEKINSLIALRKSILEPYKKAIIISDYELGSISDYEFDERLNKAKINIVEIEKEEIRIQEIKQKRLDKLEPYLLYISTYDVDNLGNYSEEIFNNILKATKNSYKIAKRNMRNNIGTFSGIGFQSGEIAKYGFIYERGGDSFIGFHLSARTSLTLEEDIINEVVKENKNEIDLGPNFKIFKRLYLNLGVGYGYYDRIINNDYAGILKVKKTGYSVASAGLMFRISRVIAINGGASFMDIEKDFFRPEITFGISFNLKRKNSY